MKKTIEFLKFRYIAYAVSLGMFVVFTVITIINGGLNMGVDFVGGVKIIAQFPKNVNEAKIREVLQGMAPVVQRLGAEEKNEYMISTKLTVIVEDKTNSKKNETNKIDSNNADTKTIVANKTDSSKKDINKDSNIDKVNKEEPLTREAQQSELVKKLINQKIEGVNYLSVENVGPAIGDMLKKSAVKLLIIAIILMTFYLTFRFEFKYSVGAMAALIHDLAITVAFCGFAGVEISVPVIAALLTIFGYSVNDTIVIFDRIRENVQDKTKLTLSDTINKSISLSLSRTLLTSLTTLFAVVSLYLIGGEGLNEFALVLLFGIVVGTYSSVYIASPILVSWEKFIAKR